MQQVSLVNFTLRPTETMMWAFMNMHHDIPLTLDEFIRQQRNKFGSDWPNIKDKFLQMIADNPHNTVLEYVNFVFIFKGFSRALQQQLTRTRDAAYSIQSLRIVNIEGNFDYHTPDRIAVNSELKHYYDNTMAEIKEGYTKLAASDGCKVEDARGVLPLNITSPITMTINLRALVRMASFRLCYLAQGEFRHLIAKVIHEITKKIGEEYKVFFKRPCENCGFCPMPICCNKTEYKQKASAYSNEIKLWLKG